MANKPPTKYQRRKWYSAWKLKKLLSKFKEKAYEWDF